VTCSPNNVIRGALTGSEIDLYRKDLQHTKSVAKLLVKSSQPKPAARGKDEIRRTRENAVIMLSSHLCKGYTGGKSKRVRVQKLPKVSKWENEKTCVSNLNARGADVRNKTFQLPRKIRKGSQPWVSRSRLSRICLPIAMEMPQNHRLFLPMEPMIK
jgi:hypothetical protein